MYKNEIIKLAALRAKVSQEQTQKVVDAFLSVISKELYNRGSIVLPDFGKFEVKTTKERDVRVPFLNSPEKSRMVHVPSKERIKFSAYANINYYHKKY